VRYAYIDSGGTRQTVRFDVNDPTGWASNEVRSSSSAFNFYTKSGNVNSARSAMNKVVAGGHPFYVAFVWGNAPVPPDA